MGQSIRNLRRLNLGTDWGNGATAELILESTSSDKRKSQLSRCNKFVPFGEGQHFRMVDLLFDKSGYLRWAIASECKRRIRVSRDSRVCVP